MAPAKNKTFIVSIMLALGIWLIALLFLASWFQRNYIHSFTHDEPSFLQADFSDQWLVSLLPHLPEKHSAIRVIQFWQPECLCNRFARPHALSTQLTAKNLSIEHITLIPSEFESQRQSLQTLNANTKIISLDTSLMKQWPASPSVFVEGPNSDIQYFGPLGYGAFCSQASTGIIENQLKTLNQSLTSPQQNSASGFYNVIGKGCFCPWG